MENNFLSHIVHIEHLMKVFIWLTGKVSVVNPLLLPLTVTSILLFVGAHTDNRFNTVIFQTVR